MKVQKTNNNYYDRNKLHNPRKEEQVSIRLAFQERDGLLLGPAPEWLSQTGRNVQTLFLLLIINMTVP